MKTKHIVIIAFLSAIIGSIVGPVFWAFTYTYDITTPAGTDSPTLADDRMRETKAAAQERLNVDHYFALTGNEVSDAATGQHRQIEFYDPITKPTNAANKGWVYTKDSASSKVELHWLDEDGNEKQVTTAGALNIVSAELLGKLDNDTYFTAVDAAGTGTVDLIKANASDEVEIFHETAHPAQLSSSDAPVSDADIANKKYVDDQIDATVGSGTADPLAYGGEQSITFPNLFILKRGLSGSVGGNTSKSIVFDDSFAAIQNIYLQIEDNLLSDDKVYITTKSKTGFTFYHYGSNTLSNVHWFAIGY